MLTTARGPGRGTRDVISGAGLKHTFLSFELCKKLSLALCTRMHMHILDFKEN